MKRLLSTRILSVAAAVLALLASASWCKAATISGVVTGDDGQPIAMVDLDFKRVSDGSNVDPNMDSTNALGQYSTSVPDDFYDVEYAPLAGTRLTTQIVRAVDLRSDRTVNVTLHDAWFVSGSLIRADTQLPAPNVGLEVEDLSTGLSLFLPNDSSDPNGLYQMMTPVGIYRLIFKGMEQGLAPLTVEEFEVDGTADLLLQTLTLPTGYEVVGDVMDEIGDIVVNADTDFFIAGTRQKIFTKGDNTDNGGKFTVVVPPGNYDIEITPPLGSTNPPAIIRGVSVTAGTSVGLTVLDEGVTVTGFVRDQDMVGLRLVDQDFHLPAGGLPVPTAYDDTDPNGRYSFRIVPGTYDITYDPDFNTQVEPVTVSGVSIVSNTTLPARILPFHDEDLDGDGGPADTCPFHLNPSQEDADVDGVGDACDRCPSNFDPHQENNDGDALGDACDPDDDRDSVPDASDPDRDGDGVPDASDNCPQAANSGQLNRDADAAGDACDPDDGEVQGLSAPAAGGFAWRAETGALRYRVYRQTIEKLSLINYGTCLQDAAEGTVVFDDGVLAPGGIFIYLATAVMPGGEGSLGRRSDGTLRPNLRPCP